MIRMLGDGYEIRRTLPFESAVLCTYTLAISAVATWLFGLHQTADISPFGLGYIDTSPCDTTCISIATVA